MQDAQIIEKIKHKDEAAMAKVIDQYARLLWTIADAVLEKVGTVEDIEECVADVFIYLWQHAENYNPEKGKLKVWLSIITRSRAINCYRKLSKHPTLAFDDKQIFLTLDIPPAAEEDNHIDLLKSAFHTLSETEQDILARRYYYEQKPKAISIALGLPTKRVENLLYRAKQKLRQKLTNQKEVSQ